MGKQDPPGPAAKLGSELHEEMEEYAKGTRDEASLNPIVRPLTQYIAAPGDINPEDVERGFRFHHKDLVVPLVGFIDLVEPGDNRVTDYKTTSAFRYAKTSEELRGDEQAVIYGTVASANCYVESLPVTFRHLYARTKGTPKTQEVEVSLDAEDLERGFTSICDTVKEMAVDAAKEPKEVTPNISACGDYGGCPFRADCTALGEKSFSAISTLFRQQASDNKENKSMNFLERLNKTRASSPKPTQTPEPEKITSSINPPDGTPEEEVEEEPSPAPAPAPEPAPEPDIPEPWATAIGETFDTDDWKKRKKAELVALAEHTFLQAHPGEVFNTDVLKGAKKGDIIEMIEHYRAPKLPEVTEGVISIDEDSEEVTVTETPAYTSAVEDDATNAIQHAQDLEKMVEALSGRVDELGQENASLREQLTGSSEPNSVLYIGCHPRRYHDVEADSVWYLDRLLAPIQMDVAKDAQLPYYGLLQYGEGPRRVAAALAGALREGLTLPSVLIADRRNPNTDAVLEVLVPYYKTIVERIS
mgnify:CR=1 FL=1